MSLVISLTDKRFPTCYCGTHDNVKVSWMWGWVSLVCDNCNRIEQGEKYRGNYGQQMEMLEQKWYIKNDD